MALLLGCSAIRNTKRKFPPPPPRRRGVDLTRGNPRLQSHPSAAAAAAVPHPPQAGKILQAWADFSSCLCQAFHKACPRLTFFSVVKKSVCWVRNYPLSFYLSWKSKDCGKQIRMLFRVTRISTLFGTGLTHEGVLTFFTVCKGVMSLTTAPSPLSSVCVCLGQRQPLESFLRVLSTSLVFYPLWLWIC